MMSTAADPSELRRRLAERRRTGEANALWPGLSVAEREGAMGEIKTVVEGVLRGTSPPPLVAEDDHAARALGIAAFTAGMGPLLGWWIQEGRVEASRPARELLGLHLDHGRRRITRLREHAARVVRAMHAEGLGPILLKGMHTGREFFPDPAVRPSSDIDVLVMPAEREAAEGVLGGLGYSLTKSVVADRSDWSLPGAATLRSVELDHAENPWTVDLHTALHRFYFRGTSVDLGPGVFATRRFVDLEGTPVRVLDQPFLSAFLALHAGCDLASVRLVRLLEIVLVIRADLEAGRLDWRELETLLTSTGTGRFVYPALALADELAPGTVEPRLLAHLARGATPRTLRVLDAVRRAGTGPLDERSFDTRLAWATGPRELARALSEVFFPSFGDSLGDTLRQRLSVARWRISRRLGRRTAGP